MNDEAIIIYSHSDFRVVYFFCVAGRNILWNYETRDFMEASGRNKSNKFFFNWFFFLTLVLFWFKTFVIKKLYYLI